MVQFFDSVSHYKKAKEPGNYQFFIADGDQLKIFNEQEQIVLVDKINEKFGNYEKIVHASYILSDLEKPWQRKMFLQQYEISNQIKAKFYVFHFQESPRLYDQLNNMIGTEKLKFNKRKCSFALELPAKTIKNKKDYLGQIQKYRKLGMSAVFDIAHVAQNGIFKDNPKQKVFSSSFDLKHQKYNKQHDDTIKQLIKFVNKSAKHFDLLHFADVGVQVDIGKDIHAPPFKDGHLFSFNNMFTSIDLLDTLIKKFDNIVLEFVDQDRLFRRSVRRYLDEELYINMDLISYYIQILRWHDRLVHQGAYGNDDTDDDLIQFSYASVNYEALAQQLIEISRQQISSKITINSPMWKKYCLPHKIAQLLLIVDLMTYFYINKIKLPWEQNIYPRIEFFDPEYKVISKRGIDTYIKKLTKFKIIKSSKQIFGSYLRGNKLIGDVDILLDLKEKKRIYQILGKDLNNDFQQQTDYNIVKFITEDDIPVQIYFASLPNPIIELFLTGSKYFNIFMRKRAKKLGFKLTNTQLQRDVGYGSYKEIKVKHQKDVFKHLQLKFVPPQFRVFLNDTEGIYDL